MSTQVYDLRNHPLRSVYLIYQALSTILIRVPWWILINIPRPFRPRASWSIQKAVMISFVKHIQSISSRTDTFRFIADHTTPSKGPGIKQVWLDPAPAELFSEQLLAWMKVASVTPARIPGYWMDKPGYESTPLGTAATPGEKIILSLHGGAYIRLSASPKDIVANIAKGILQHTPSVKRTFAVEYRLSKTAPDTSTHAFPAALLDALAGYIYLIKNVGVAPQDIILTGDSAGANLAQALTRYLIDTRSIISYLPPPPSSLLLLSPWADLSNSHVPAWECRDNVDYLGAPDSAMSHYARNAFFGAHGPQIGLSPYVSPATISPAAESSSFVGFPRTMIVAGGAEALIPSITTLKERMSRDLGNKLVYYEAKDAVHDFLVFVFWEPERTEALHAISKWIGD